MGRIIGLVVAALMLMACGRESAVVSTFAEATESAEQRPSPSPSPKPTPTPTPEPMAPTPAPTPEPSPEPTPVEWKRVDEGGFSFAIPSDMQREDVQPIDSQVGVFTNDRLEVSYDYGWYSASCSDDAQRTHIDGREAMIDMFVRDTDPSDAYTHYACVIFPDVDETATVTPTPAPSGSYDSTTRLGIIVRSNHPDDDWPVAKHIFESVRFED